MKKIVFIILFTFSFLSNGFCYISQLKYTGEDQTDLELYGFQGNVKSVKIIINGELEMESVFNKRGNLEQQVNFKNWTTGTYERDEYDKLISVTYKDLNKGSSSSTTYLYDEYNNVISKTFKIEGDSSLTEHKYIYTYDENGVITNSIKKKYDNGKLCKYYTTLYKNGKKYINKGYNSNDELISSTIYEYTNTSKKFKVYSYKINEQTKQVEYTFTEDKKLVMVTEQSFMGNSTIIFDEQGNPIKKTDIDDEVKVEETYNYTYDEHNNPIQLLFTRYINGKKHYQEIINYKIVYF